MPRCQVPIPKLPLPLIRSFVHSITRAMSAFGKSGQSVDPLGRSAAHFAACEMASSGNEEGVYLVSSEGGDGRMRHTCAFNAISQSVSQSVSGSIAAATSSLLLPPPCHHSHATGVLSIVHAPQLPAIYAFQIGEIWRKRERER